jgi:hypothetical protein
LAPIERPSSCHASPGGIRSLTPARSSGLLIFFFGFRPTCRVPKKVGPRIFTLTWSSTIVFIWAPRSLAKNAFRWFASRKR